MEDKTMKKVFGIAALLLALAACNKIESENGPVENIVGIPFSATVSLGDNAATKALAESGSTIVAAWAKGEKVALIHNGVSDEMTVSSVSGGVATITGTITGSPSDGDAVAIIYPSTAADGTTGNVKADLLTTQDGTLATIASAYDVRKGSGTLAVSSSAASLSGNVSLTNQFAIFKFTLSGPSIDATHPLVIKDNASNTTITTVTPASTATSVFVAMPAAASTTYKFVVITADNKYIKSGTATIEAGKYYQTTLTMSPRYPLALSSATAEWDLGAVACSDGNLYMEKKAAPSGKTAVGIVGKVTETGRGLMLALQDATNRDWNTINGWTSTTDYASTTLKVLPDDAARGSLKSYIWLGGALDHILVSNWCVAQKSDYEEIFQNLGSTDYYGYGTTYDDNVNAYITTGVGGTAMTSNYYWSATEYDGSFAWHFGYGWYNLGKTHSYSVRPVLGFGPVKLLSAATTSDIGKVVCADGHLHDAKTAVPHGRPAVGILGKVTETGHGLILALQDAKEQTWDTINGWFSTTQFAGGTTLKVLPDNDARGSLTDYFWLGGTLDHILVSNWAVAQMSDYAEIFQNLGSTTRDKDGYTYDSNVNAYITTGVGGTALSDAYWSATEYASLAAWFFYSDWWSENVKTWSYNVRPVLGF